MLNLHFPSLLLSKSNHATRSIDLLYHNRQKILGMKAWCKIKQSSLSIFAQITIRFLNNRKTIHLDLKLK